jgi:hypothetical protein
MKNFAYTIDSGRVDRIKVLNGASSGCEGWDVAVVLRSLGVSVDFFPGHLALGLLTLDHADVGAESMEIQEGATLLDLLLSTHRNRYPILISASNHLVAWFPYHRRLVDTNLGHDLAAPVELAVRCWAPWRMPSRIVRRRVTWKHLESEAVEIAKEGSEGFRSAVERAQRNDSL